MQKSPSTTNARPGMKNSVKKSVACQTDNNGSYGSSTSSPSLSQEFGDPNVADNNPNVPSSTAGRSSNAAAARSHPETGENTSEGTITVTIPKFSIMTDTMCSNAKKVQGVPWRIMVMPKQHVVQKKQQKCMGFFLQCCPEKVYSDAWSCKADAEMRLLSKKQGVNNFVRKTSHIYTSKENDWGYSCFMTWADVLDENQGYIKNDSITLEISVKAEPPKNLMTREEFVKAIDQWYNLAEMQMTRGMIDLSLEANAQGIKFCKDKDEEMRKKLEEQKSRLVKKKVIDSISRIENHGTQPKSSEPLKPTSLRQALTGAQKTIVSKSGKTVAANKRDRKAATLQQIKKKKQENAAKLPHHPVMRAENAVCCHLDSPSCTQWTTDSPRYSVTDSEDEGHLDETQSEADSNATFDVVCSRTLDETESEDGDEGDDEDFSDYYNEDEEAQSENQLTDESIHGSSSSLEHTLGETVDGYCQTDLSGDPLPNPSPRRERMHFVLSYPEGVGEEDDEDIDANEETDYMTVSPLQQSVIEEPADGEYASNSEIAARFLEEMRDDSSSYFKKLAAGHEASLQDHEKVDEWCNEHFGDLSEQIASLTLERLKRFKALGLERGQTVQQQLDACLTSVVVSRDICLSGLVAGLCAVSTRRCAQHSRDFKKLVSETFKDEYKMAAKMIVDSEKQMSRIRAVHVGINEAMQKHNLPPSEFTLDLAEDSASGGQKITEKDAADCAAFIEKMIAEDEDFNEKVTIYRKSEVERHVEKLIQDIGETKFDVCIADKMQKLIARSVNNSTLVAVMMQLFNYFRTVTEQKHELQRTLEFAKAMFKIKTKNGGLSYKTQVIKDNERRLQDSEMLLKKMGHTYQIEAERSKKLQEELTDALNKTKNYQLTLDQLQNQLKDTRNLAKKADKKAKQEETKSASLMADKLDLEDKLKTAKKEADQLKKKSTEERNNAKKQKDRDHETIRRLEAEAAEKEAEKDRERTHFEEKIRESRTRENKAEKERKQALANNSATLERARAAESVQVNLLFEFQQQRFEKARDEIKAGISEAEKNLKRAHNTQADQDTMKKNLAEWKTALEELEKTAKDTKSEYDNSAELVKKGQVLLSHLELSQPALPTLPKTIRLPPVQVVQPSTAASLPAPQIVPPPAGVIGQPRVSVNGAGVIGQPSSRPQVSAPPTLNGSMPGPSYNSMKMSEPAGPALSQQQPTSLNPASSLWNWSSPLEDVTSSVFRDLSSVSVDHSRAPQPPGPSFEEWVQRNDYTPQTLNRSMYGQQQQAPPVNWASSPGWQQGRPSSAMAQQPQQYRGMPPYPFQ